MKIGTLELKSAEVITDPEEVYRRLAEANEKNRVRMNGYADHTRLSRTDEGKTVVGKRVGSVITASGEASLVEKQMDFSAIAGQPTELQRVAQDRGIQWESALASRAIPYWASDQRPDAHGDIVLQNWIFDEFEDNHPLANSHDWGGFPIGSVIAWQVVQRSTAKYMGPALQVLSLFATKEQYGVADTAFRLVRSGFLVGGSVGFASDKVIDIKDDDERAKLGLGRWGFVLDDNHLLEFSPTLLGANSGAFAILSRAKSRGMLMPKDFEVIREIERQTAVSSDAKDKWDGIDVRYVQMAHMLFPDVEFKRHKDVEEPLYEQTDDPLKDYVPGADLESDPDGRIERIEESLERLTSLVEEGLLGLGSTLSDVRETLERMSGTATTASVQSDDGNGPDGDDDTDSNSDSTVDSLLRRLEELNTDIKALHDKKES